MLYYLERKLYEDTNPFQNNLILSKTLPVVDECCL